MRVRLRFTKLGKVRWTSHRDVARVWERALRRTQVPLVYSEGFSPRPRISFGLALPTGAESLAEYLDVDLAVEPDAVTTSGLPGRLSPALPDGIEVTAAAGLEPGAPSLQHDVVACRWEMDVPDEGAGAEAVAGFLEAPSVVMSRQRKGQPTQDDVRPAVLSLRLVEIDPRMSRLEAELATTTRGLRPAELLGVLGFDAAESRIVRTHQWIERDDARREPLAATDAPPARRQAS